MPTKKLSKPDKQYLVTLGHKIQEIIIHQMEYSSLDAFSLEHHDKIAKPTLYQICEGKRDMKLSTFFSLSRALNLKPEELISIKSIKRSI